jgi:hypothetical protein
MGHRAWSMGQKRDDAGTRRNGETEIRGQRSEVRDQRKDYRGKIRLQWNTSVAAAFQPRSRGFNDLPLTTDYWILTPDFLFLNPQFAIRNSKLFPYAPCPMLYSFLTTDHGQLTKSSPVLLVFCLLQSASCLLFLNPSIP